MQAHCEGYRFHLHQVKGVKVTIEGYSGEGVQLEFLGLPLPALLLSPGKAGDVSPSGGAEASTGPGVRKPRGEIRTRQGRNNGKARGAEGKWRPDHPLGQTKPGVRGRMAGRTGFHSIRASEAPPLPMAPPSFPL